MVGGMKLKTSPSSPSSSLVCRHMRYILPTLLLLAAVVVSAAAEERVTLREPRPPRLQQQPTERPVRARHHPRRRQEQEHTEPGLFQSGALPGNLNADAQNHHHGFSNSTALQHAQRRRGANFTLGM